MPELNARQSAFVERVYARKLYAMRQIARHVDMLPLTPEKAAKHRAVIGEPAIVWALAMLAADGVSAYKRGAAVLILDLISPDWRDVAGPEILGFVVERDSAEVRAWRKLVIANDEGRCCKCGSPNKLHAHHIVRWADDPSLRIAPENGMTLCEACHIEEHRHHG